MLPFQALWLRRRLRSVRAASGVISELSMTRGCDSWLLGMPWRGVGTAWPTRRCVLSLSVLVTAQSRDWRTAVLPRPDRFCVSSRRPLAFAGVSLIQCIDPACILGEGQSRDADASRRSCIPNDLSFEASVVGLMPSSSAAPPGPETLPRLAAIAERRLARSKVPNAS